jgi:spermine/spermidine synthase
MFAAMGEPRWSREKLDLFLASFLMLFVELVLIRWTGAWVVHLSFFANFVLLGSFLGIGLGFLRADRGPDLFRWSPILLAFMLGLVVAFPSQIDRTGGDLVFFGVAASGTPAWVILPFVFLATALTLMTIAQGVAVRFARFPALEAYRLDILGSIAGTVAFALLALLGGGPLAWGVVMALLFVYLLRHPSMLQWSALAATIVVLAVGGFRGETIWSPYYRLSITHQGGVTAIDANGVPHQAAQPTTGTDYEIPYSRIDAPPRRVLVIGAGNGNDVAVALRNGAQSVTAVEIDPEIQALGARYHPERPYDDPRVVPVIADGRAFLEGTHDRYDLIVFALPDSLTLVGGQSSVRLESYLFTEEAFVAARRLLTSSGSFALYNFYRERWLADRIAGTLTRVFGSKPCIDLRDQGQADVGRVTMFVASRDPSGLRCIEGWDPGGREVVPPASDDRPFLYLRTPSIPGRYLATLSLILLASLVLVRVIGGSTSSLRGYGDLFFMGAAFLLLETKSVVQFALLFGTTWFVNALVFVGILLSVWLAIEVERKVRIGRPLLLLGLLLLGLAVAAVVPASVLLGLSTGARFAAAIMLAFFPIFMANLVFAERFRDAAEPTAAFAANLIGAMVGGSLEYLSLIFGYRSLLLLAAILYCLSFAFARRRESAVASAAGPLTERGPA